MDFLNKLYESNYFGIGLFAVISVLVVTFLIVLFFGKRDEKKRQLEKPQDFVPTKPVDTNAFKETTPITPIDLNSSVAPTEISSPVTPIEPVAPISMDMPTNNVAPILEPTIAEQPVTPKIETPIIEAPVIPEPIVNERVINEPVIPPIHTPITEPVKPVINNDINRIPDNNIDLSNITPVIPVNPEPTPVIPVTPDVKTPIFEESTPVVEPKVMEPVRFDINNMNNVPNNTTSTEIYNKPVETPIVEPIIKEEVKPIVTPIIEEPVINGSYYRPVETPKVEEVKVPNFDFDAIAKSISKELDELENNVSNTYQEEPVVTPIKEITTPVEPRVIPTQTPQFSSVYVNNTVRPTITEENKMPNKIDLPTMKDHE